MYRLCVICVLIQYVHLSRADGICINQNDEEEKTHQVRMMDRIYAFGKKVLIWLGDMEPPKALGSLELLCQLASEVDEAEQSQVPLPPRTSNDAHSTSPPTHREDF